jgi:2-methylcitrate dehydratase PrpD
MGILAYHLLMSGFTGEADGIRSVYGGVVSDSFDPAMMVEGIGSRYEITRNYFKKYACCRYNHSSLDALYKIMGKQKEGKIRPELVEHITIETYSLAAQLSDQNPGNMLAAKFSIPFAIATTIIHGNSGVECFLPDQVSQPKIRELAARVKVVEKPEFTQLMPSQRPSTVTIRFRNGEAFTETVFITRGDIEDPYSTEEIEEKFLDITSPIYGMEKAKAIVEKTKRIETFNNIQDYTDGL